MAKTPKIKKKEIPKHSRAARRALSPPPTSLTASAPAEETDYKPWLHTAQDAGVSKRNKKGKQISRQQKLRRQKGVEKAEQDLDKLEQRIQDSLQRDKKVRTRRMEWNELNDDLVGVGKKKGGGKKNEKIAEAAGEVEKGAMEEVELLEPNPMLHEEADKAEGPTAIEPAGIDVDEIL